MAGRVSTFDITQVICLFGPVVLQGFADDEVVVVEDDEEQEKVVEGVDGDLVRVPRAGKSATITVRLMHGSPASIQLREWKTRFPRGPLDQAPFVIKDLNNLRTHQSNIAWITSMPRPSFGADAPTEEWKFKLASYEEFNLVQL